MLIDATHPEETRVVVTRGNRVEEFDYELASRKQLRGNIYLAKVARIEPSLQAAFVNYGGNRHGFLAFAEIHPDYYQIPVAVREAIMKEEAIERQSHFHDGDDASEAEAKQAGEGDEHAVDAANDVTETNPTAEAEQAPAEVEENEAPDLPVEASAEAVVVGEKAKAEQAVEPEPVAEGARPEQEQAGVSADKPLALEAILPPTIYEKFAEAVARAEEARDEIPAHPDDVEEEAPAEKEEVGEPADAATPTQDEASEERSHHEHAASGDDDGGTWEHNGASGEGGIISVPEPAIPAQVEVVGSEDALEELPQRHKRRWRHYKI